MQASPRLSQSYPNPRSAHQRQGLGEGVCEGREMGMGAACRLRPDSPNDIQISDLHTRDRAWSRGRAARRLRPDSLIRIIMQDKYTIHRACGRDRGAVCRAVPQSLALV